MINIATISLCHRLIVCQFNLSWIISNLKLCFCCEVLRTTQRVEWSGHHRQRFLDRRRSHCLLPVWRARSSMINGCASGRSRIPERWFEMLSLSKIRQIGQFCSEISYLPLWLDPDRGVHKRSLFFPEAV